MHNKSNHTSLELHRIHLVVLLGASTGGGHEERLLADTDWASAGGQMLPVTRHDTSEDDINRLQTNCSSKGTAHDSS